MKPRFISGPQLPPCHHGPPRRINVPFAGKFAERAQLMRFLRKEVAWWPKSEIRWGRKKTGDPLVNIQKTAKNHGKSPFSSWVKQNYFYGHVQKRC